MKIPVIAGVILASFSQLFSAFSQAGINLENTRVVLAAPSKEASLVIKNSAAEDLMFQAWVEAADKSEDVPFAITPVLKRLSGEQQQVLRILYSGKGLPTDKESVFWLNVREVPQKSREENTLQIAVQQRLKLFYRPAGLPGTIAEAPQQLKWRLLAKDGKTYLEVSNPSAFHQSFAAITLRMGSQSFNAPIDMVAPTATARVEIPELPSGVQASDLKVEFEVIGDYGGILKYDGATSG
ncbi:chaperone CupC2 [Pseudomonas chlororaphis subsp. aurantiaca]|uniref:fimbrial biogenesis chaperone n=1 Tax=Pseudomonas chlororaphis TaxID=587753 RepID=UPI00086497E6|nr:molecular chaperone [Pseudomonas chlororaphis]BAV73794.1 gram-negative pili assembly chaperone, CupC2 family [Pseudomonas chlororaphis subsp. aurantiaca]BBN53713.1 chaperone CupC2 [Pseudomonas chlororaphis subsp. aurantiaca]